MAYTLIIPVIVLAILDWLAVEKQWKIVEYIAKPATMLAILAWIWVASGWGGSMLWFTVGVIFCLLGDIFLMLPWNMFLFGLLAFLAGHIFYVIGLNTSAPYFNLLGIFLVILVVMYIAWLYPRLAGGLHAKDQDKLKIPVLIYAIVISSMVYSALLTWTRPGWSNIAALIASAGALLFYASDSMLAWDRFINPLSHARLRVMVTYHLGQIGIILGAMLFVGIK